MAKAKKAAKAGKKAGGGREVLVVGSKVKAYVKSKGAMSSGELVPSLSEQVYGLIDKAIARAQGNKRSTVQPKDL
jgi:histone H3/H4